MEWTRRAVIGGLAATVSPLRGLEPATHAAPVAADGFTVLAAGPGSLRLRPRPAPETGILAYNGSVPGPLLRVRHGDEVKVRLVNALAQPTTLAWHGMRLPNAMDGVGGLTQAPVAPGGRFDYRFTPPDAGLFWYHPHIFPDSAEQIARGLYGVVIVEERAPPPVDQDILIVLDDWALDAAGHVESALDRTAAAREGRIGDLITVNSTPVPPPPVEVRPGARLRLRLLNVCGARIALLALVGADAEVVAIDGQPSEIFPPAGGMVPIGPGARFELVADMPRTAGAQARLVLRDVGAPDRLLLTFATKGRPLAVRAAPAKLAANPLLPTRIALETAVKIDLPIGGPAPAPAPWLWTLAGAGSNGVSGKPLFRVKRDHPVTLAFANKTGFVQQMHVHGHVFRVLHDLDDGWDPYWRDSILVGPGKTKHVAFVADNPGKWAIESLVLDRQITGLAAWFEVS